MALRRILCGLTVASALVFGCQIAHAGKLKIGNSAHRIGNGGEFRITKKSGEAFPYYIPPADQVMQYEPDSAEFLTFCIEHQEYIALGGTYGWSVDDAAIGGGGGAVNGQDPVGEATAKLFYAYWTGQLDELSNFTYEDDTSTTATDERAVSGHQLQLALWYLEDEISAPSSGTLADDLVTLSGNLTWADLGEAGWTGTGGVKALNLYNADGSNAQSQLIVVPLPPAVLLGLALMSMLALGSFLRRRHRRLGLR
jgi:hypothetical protein